MALCKCAESSRSVHLAHAWSPRGPQQTVCSNYEPNYVNLPPEADGARKTPAVGVGGATTAGYQRQLQQLNYRERKARVQVHLKVDQTPDD